MITFPETLDQAAAALTDGAEIRAGATDLQERRRHHISHGPLVDLRDLGGLDAVEETADGGLRIGALVPVQALADDPRVQRGWPGLAAAAGGLATPQVRARATVGGNLLQQSRCWYYRNPDFTCLRNGGGPCLARTGDHQLHACYDQGPCLCLHPSTLAAAFIAWDATAEIHGGQDRAVAAVAAKNVDPTRPSQLEPGEVLAAVLLAPPVAGERSAYHRTIHRARAEWPLVEVVARIQVDGDTIRAGRVVVGGVANQPVSFPALDAALAGSATDEAALAGVAALAVQGVSAPPMTAYKLKLVPPSIQDAIEAALASEGAALIKEPEDADEEVE